MNAIGILLALLCGSTVIFAVWSILRDRQSQMGQESLPPMPFIAETKTPERMLPVNLENALKFESFITSKFNKVYFTLLDWRSDKSHDGIFALSNLNPDLKFEFGPDAIRFSVECKWRKSFYHGGIVINKDHLISYLEYQQRFEENVFFVIGVGGSPEMPEDLYIVPVSDISTDTTVLPGEFLKQYRRRSDGDFYFDPQLRRLK
jgi:hypothetical protein